MTLLAEDMRRAKRGYGAMIVVEGSAGIGKTALLGATARIARRLHFEVRRGRGRELEQAFAYGVVRQLFEPLLAAATAAERKAMLDGAAALAKGPLGLETPPRPETLGAGAELGPLHGLYWLTATLAERAPVCLIVDDGHWADVPTQRFLAYLSPRLPELPVAVVVATRVSGLEEIGASWSATRVISPAPLSAEAVDSLVRQRLSPEADPAFCAACHAATGGNPFLLTELLATIAADSMPPLARNAARVSELRPSSIERAALARVGALGEAPVALARAVAVLGTSAELRQARRLAGLGEEAAAIAADQLAAADVLRPGRPLEFVHPLVRSSIYETIPPAWRALSHARAARLLAEEGAPIDRVAAQLLHAEPAAADDAVEALRSAARLARSRRAPELAGRYLRRALAEPPKGPARIDVLLELADAEMAAGEATAVGTLRDALAATTDPRRRAQLSFRLGGALYMTGEVEEARLAFADGLREIAEQRADEELVIQLRAGYLTVARDDPERLLPEGTIEAILDGKEPGRSSAERLLLALTAIESLRAGTRPCDRVAALARRALAGESLLVERGPDSFTFYGPCIALYCCGAFDEAERALSSAIGLARRHGSMLGFASASHFRGVSRYVEGRIVDAIADLQSAVDGASQYGWALSLPAAHAILAACLLERGQVDDAEGALAMPGGVVGWMDQPSFSYWLQARGRIRAARGSHEAALADLLECGALQVKLHSPNPAHCWWRSDAAISALQLGRREQARALAREELELARAFGAARAVGVALRAAGLVEGGAHGLQMLEEAVVTLRGSGADLELAYALVELGAAARRAGHRVDSREPLRQGLDLADRASSTRLAKRARAELLAAGARPRRERISGAHALTASERRVAEMAAAGMSNREIAQALFVTIRTVTTHLGHVYQKLGITGREQLADQLPRDTAAELVER